MSTLYMGDQVVRVSVVDSLGAAVDLTNYAAYGIIVYVANSLVQQYMDTEPTGYLGTTAVSLATGVFDINLRRQDLESVPDGTIQGQAIAYTTDTDFLADKKILIGSPATIATLDKNKNITSTTGY